MRDALSLEGGNQFNITHILSFTHDYPYKAFEDIISDEINIDNILTQDLNEAIHNTSQFLLKVKLEGGRVLLYCTTGLSLSPGFLISYLVNKENTIFKDAFNLVKMKKPDIDIHANLIAHIMSLENSIYKTVSLNWLEVPTKEMSVLDWLKEHHDPNGTPTHLWWEILSKDRYNIPIPLFPQLYALYAKNKFLDYETLKMVEICSGLYGLHLDLDIKSSTDKLGHQVIFNFFLPRISKLFNEHFKRKAYFVVTGVEGRFFPAAQPLVSWRYGYHIIWPEVMVNVEEHKIFTEFCISSFKNLLESHQQKINEGQEGVIETCFVPLITELLQFNEWQQVFDMTIFESSEPLLRMLFSWKAFTCKSCRKQGNVSKKHRKEKPKDCKYCEGTGMLDKRFHRFMAIYTEDATLDQPKSNQLVGRSDLEGLHSQITLASVLLRKAN
uniref:protein-tyrosine-phosphatase n=1 Tax=Arcella intermedia TaxID=1963864 RepID=A0A6B2L3Z1_9EUKA